jgi:putative SOS response-associated peptidase YedK
MPVILPTETHEPWLIGVAGKEILLSLPAEAMKIRAVSGRVNKPENDDPGLLEEGEIQQVGRLI